VVSIASGMNWCPTPDVGSNSITIVVSTLGLYVYTIYFNQINQIRQKTGVMRETTKGITN